MFKRVYSRLALEVGGSRHSRRRCQASLSSPLWERMASKAANSYLKNAFVLVTNSIEKGSRPRIMSKSLNDLQLLRPQCATAVLTHACVCLWLPLKVFLWPVVDTATRQA